MSGERAHSEPRRAGKTPV
ncbi:hypothetical protein EYF80_067940 [Liparis tanakae]|uniref:Uncharacterized protein n=1 Tax=Liparis tanakae TaxID=230148 RepID=A0A4Z2DZT1_9TELE|nr:hypothetical protein EYF80_067940 [Liparis tanakae]